MKYYINGYDLEAMFGVIITNGANAFLQLPDRKESVQNDFQNEDGIDIDLFAPKFKARTFAFNCVITAPTIEAFKTQYFGFFQLLKQQELYEVFNDWLNMMLFLYYQKQANISNMYNTSSGGFGMTFQLQFGETEPFNNMPFVELVDDLFNVLVP